MTEQQRKLDDLLLEAVQANDRQRVTRLARSGANVNQVWGHGWTPIAMAMLHRNRKLCEVLLEFGADPTVGLQVEGSALDFACGRDADSVWLVRALVNRGVPPNWLIHAATRQGTVGTVRQLLKRGADPNLQNSSGDRPLREARSPTVIRELFRFGADPLTYSANFEHPLHFNATWDRPENVRALLEGGVPPDYPEPGPPDQPDIGEAYALHMAVSGGWHRSARVLLEGGANPELLSTYHVRPPLMVAAQRGSVRLVRLLLNAGADRHRCVNGDTARSSALSGLACHPEKEGQYRKILTLLN